MSLYRALAVQSMSVCLSVPQLKCIRSSKWRVCLFYCTSPMQSAVPAAYSVVQSLCSSRGPSATAERFVHVVVFVLHAVFARLAVLAEHSAVSLSLSVRICSDEFNVQLFRRCALSIITNVKNCQHHFTFRNYSTIICKCVNDCRIVSEHVHITKNCTVS